MTRASHWGRGRDAATRSERGACAARWYLPALLCAGVLGCGGSDERDPAGASEIGASDVDTSDVDTSPAGPESAPSAAGSVPGAASPATDALFDDEPTLGGSCTPRLGAETFTSPAT
jgi:hypothetical protein